MLGRRFTLDPGFAAAVSRTSQVRDLLDEKATAAAEEAANRAPFATGALAESVFADVALTADGYRGRVGAEDFKAPWFEEGAAGVPARPFLRPAVEAEVGPIEAHPDDGEE